MNGPHPFVGAGMRHLERIAQPGHAQHPAATGDDVVALALRAGVIDEQVIPGIAVGRIAGDHIAQIRLARIAGRCQHHAQGAAPVPFGLHLVQPALDAGLDERAQRRSETAQDGLCFGVAQPAVEFQRVQAAVTADHQARIQKARERRALGRHAADGRQDDLAQRAGMDVGGDDRSRRIGAHAARVRALVAIEQPLVVLAGGQRQHVLAVGHHDEAGFLARQEGFHHHPGRIGIAGRLAGQPAGYALAARGCLLATAGEGVGQELVDGRMGLLDRLRHHHALAGRQPVGLHHDGRALLADVGFGGRRIGEGLVGGGGYPVPLHEGLGKILRGFQPGRRPGGAEHRQPAPAEVVHQPLGQWGLGAHHGEGQLLALGKQRQRTDIAHRQVAHAGLERRTGIAGRHEHRFERMRACQGQRDGVFTSTATHHQAPFLGCHQYCSGLS